MDIFTLDNKERFISLLKDTKREGVENLIKWLEGTDFFIAPASTRFHSNYEGGLCQHSLNVYKIFKKKCEDNEIELDESNIIIASLLHDICKANYYVVSSRNVKRDGKWIQVPYYSVDDQNPLGHGEKSCLILQTFIKLTKEELYCIRWHMGGYEPKENLNTISAAWNLCKPAVLLHTADLEASYLIEEHREV
ncbi:HD domain-containing protein [Clostridium septicum]|uniref:HD domain-containing protein n=1 Tax=Clostridium septicum TaxID=1504 RepID=A0A9N7JNS3_CLOSE|nr:HD domain-containing protein [Clostridium septicum]AYE35285.1 metal-dependent phosphohydrolase [Clostridium septicum]QAS60679.1 HD domain-containing protein [Clostridium septicum]UEC20063.1 HD domain-containing protein [Clostridium septicum]USS01881.1 HD domain-containing protein [Clostridium septicum]